MFVFILFNQIWLAEMTFPYLLISVPFIQPPEVILM